MYKLKRWLSTLGKNSLSVIRLLRPSLYKMYCIPILTQISGRNPPRCEELNPRRTAAAYMFSINRLQKYQAGMTILAVRILDIDAAGGVYLLAVILLYVQTGKIHNACGLKVVIDRMKN